MSVDYAHSARANAARTRKAMLIEDGLVAAGIPAAAAAELTDKARRRIERAAGARRASEETWALAIAFLRDREEHQR